MDHSFVVKAVTVSGETRPIAPTVTENGNTVTLRIPKALLCEPRYQTLTVETDLAVAHAGDRGYMFYPTNFYYGFALTRFEPRKDTEFRTWPTATTVSGICENENAVFIRIDGEAFDSRFIIRCIDNTYSIGCHFKFDGDEPDEDITVIYTKMPYATYADMARFYRRFQLTEKGCVPLRERAERREMLRRAADGMELRIRMGWKPIPTPVRHQTKENEPPMKVACDIKALNKIIDSMHRKGVDKAEICLVGWGPGGHDGRFPQQYPSDERFGGDDELRKFIAKAQRLGYLVVCHTVSCGAYEIADNWDPDLCTQRYDPETGKLVPYIRDHYKKDGLNGGEPYHLCAKTAFEHYMTKDLPVVRGYGFAGLHYNDELTAIIPEKCYSPDHPVTRKEAWEYHRKLAKLATDLFGGYQSEGYMDYMNAYVDATLYIGVQSKLTHEMHPLFDEGIPFYQLVYHGIILSNPTSQTINYPIKETYQHLKFIEYGGRPVMYFYSKFGEDRNWMGDLDLHCGSDEEIERSTDAIKAAYDEYERFKHLQYEFMDNHEKLAEGVYRTTYSDGTVTVVDYNTECFTVTSPDGKTETYHA